MAEKRFISLQTAICNSMSLMVVVDCDDYIHVLITLHETIAVSSRSCDHDIDNHRVSKAMALYRVCRNEVWKTPRQIHIK